MTGSTKDCPLCGETVKAVAIKCRYCQSDIRAVAVEAFMGASPAAPQPPPDQPPPLPATPPPPAEAPRAARPVTPPSSGAPVHAPATPPAQPLLAGLTRWLEPPERRLKVGRVCSFFTTALLFLSGCVWFALHVHTSEDAWGFPTSPTVVDWPFPLDPWELRSFFGGGQEWIFLLLAITTAGSAWGWAAAPGVTGRLRQGLVGSTLVTAAASLLLALAIGTTSAALTSAAFHLLVIGHLVSLATFAVLLVGPTSRGRTVDGVWGGFAALAVTLAFAVWVSGGLSWTWSAVLVGTGVIASAGRSVEFARQRRAVMEAPELGMVAEGVNLLILAPMLLYLLVPTVKHEHFTRACSSSK